MAKTKWLIYTVLIGLVPFFVRAIIFLVTKGIPPAYILNEVDMVAFGLVLNISNINELDSPHNTMDLQKKTINIGCSVFMIIIFAAFLMVSYMADLPNQALFDKSSIRNLSVTLSVVSFVLVIQFLKGYPKNHERFRYNIGGFCDCSCGFCDDCFLF